MFALTGGLTMLAGIALAGILYLTYRDISRAMFLIFGLMTYLVLLFWRIIARSFYRRRNQAAEHGIAPVRLDHTLLYGPNVAEVEKIFTEVLGFYLVESVLTPDGKSNAAIWLSCSHKVHDIAFAEYPEPGKLHHISFLLTSWEKVLRSADIMSMKRVPIDIGPTRHGITRGATIYAFDPSGNRFETFAQGYETYPDYPVKTWTFEEAGTGIFYHDRKLNESFLSVVT